MASTNDDLVAWMRAKGVIAAQFDADGRLLGCSLGPEVPNNTPEPRANLTPEEQAKAEEDEYERTLYQSS